MQARAYMRLNFTIAGAMALALMLAAIFVTTLSLGAGAVPAPAVEPQSGEESIAALMQGQPYDGPAVATPRGLDGKPDFTGVWRPVREKGKPGGNLGKDYPGFRLPYTEQRDYPSVTVRRSGAGTIRFDPMSLRARRSFAEEPTATFDRIADVKAVHAIYVDAAEAAKARPHQP